MARRLTGETMEHNDHAAERAKSALLYYFTMLAHHTGKPLDSDCRSEIRDIVDNIIDAAVRAASKED